LPLFLEDSLLAKRWSEACSRSIQVGEASNANIDREAFLYDATTMHNLSDLIDPAGLAQSKNRIELVAEGKPPKSTTRMSGGIGTRQKRMKT
jgi:hypothetical protein